MVSQISYLRREQGMNYSNTDKISVITSPKAGRLEKLAAKVFCEELLRKTGIEAADVTRALNGGSYIVIATDENLKEDFPQYYKLVSGMEVPAQEGYRFFVDKKDGIKIVVCGADQRGAFYGMGRALRKLSLKKGCIEAGENVKPISTSPKYPLRGHQLGHRSKNNTHDAWTIEQYDRYIRELAIFGANAIEILPVRTDDDLYSQLFKEDPVETMIKLSETIKSYGMDVWIWYPNMGTGYEKDETIEKEVAEREKIFSVLPYIDCVMVPGGDPGHLHPKTFFPVTEKCIEPLKKYHPNAKVWISEQASTTTQEWLDSFFEELGKEPWWVDGMVFAPWTRDNIDIVRKLTPDKYPIRNYPDISHSLQAQYPVPNMDMRFGMVYGREAINPRPVHMKFLHNKYEKYTVGALTYSEGIHDDINKFVWMDQDWDPDMPSEETIEDYVRFFIDPCLVEEATEAIFDLEQNWLGEITDRQIGDTYKKWLAIEEKMGGEADKNFRLQMCLIRAYMDYYIKRRYLDEKEYEERALKILNSAGKMGADKSIEKAWFVLDTKMRYPTCDEIRTKIQKLSDSLFDLIGIQLTVKHHRGQYTWRGAFVDCLDIPLNDYRWLTWNFKKILKLADENEKLSQLRGMLNRTKVGKGEYYTNLGTPESLKHIEIENTYEKDPGYLYTAHIDVDMFGSWESFSTLDGNYKEVQMPLAWLTRARTNYGVPLKLKYDKLDINAEYMLKVVYYLAFNDLNYRLTAGDDIIIHDGVKGRGKENFSPLFEYMIPKDAYKSGTLNLRWDTVGNLGRIQIHELWLVKTN